MSGFEIRMLSDHELTKVSHIAQSKEVTAQSGIKFNEGEYIQKVIFGYDEKAIRGLRLLTNKQKIKLGAVYESEFVVESNKFDSESAIIGFNFVFGEDRIVEISVFSAPLKNNNDSGQVSRMSKTVILPSYKNKEEKVDFLKETFKLYKKLKKNKSF